MLALSEEQVKAAIEKGLAMGPLRIAISCAGVGWAARTLNKEGQPHDLELFKTVIGVNLIGSVSSPRTPGKRRHVGSPTIWGFLIRWAMR